MINKIIHYMWFGGKEMPDDLKKNLASWKKYCPDFEFMCWDESNFDVNMCDFTRQTFETKKFGFLSDYVRLYALKKYGGIYLDLDIEMLKPIDDLLENDSFIGFENKYWCGSTPIGGQGEWIDDLLEIYNKRDFIVNGKMQMIPAPVIFTDVLVKKYGLIQNNTLQKFGGLTVYPDDYLSPKNFWTGEIKTTENSYFIHYYAASWFGAKDKIANFFGHMLKGIIGNKNYNNLIEKASLNDGKKKMKALNKALKKKEERLKKQALKK